MKLPPSLHLILSQLGLSSGSLSVVCWRLRSRTGLHQANNLSPLPFDGTQVVTPVRSPETHRSCSPFTQPTYNERLQKWILRTQELFRSVEIALHLHREKFWCAVFLFILWQPNLLSTRAVVCRLLSKLWRETNRHLLFDCLKSYENDLEPPISVLFKCFCNGEAFAKNNN